MAAVLIAMNGPLLPASPRGLCLCSARATNSLPEPVSPVISTVTLLCDSRPIANARLDTWSTFASDVPPETPGYEWKRNAAAAKVRPPTGLGAKVTTNGA